MEFEIVKSEKDDLEIVVDNGTIAEVLRVNLNKIDGVKKAVWRRDHPSKPVLMKVQTKGKTARKAISEAVLAIKKDLSVLKQK